MYISLHIRRSGQSTGALLRSWVNTTLVLQKCPEIVAASLGANLVGVLSAVWVLSTGYLLFDGHPGRLEWLSVFEEAVDGGQLGSLPGRLSTVLEPAEMVIVAAIIEMASQVALDF